MLAPVDAVVEPVEDEQQHADRDQRDDRLELLPVAAERFEHGLRDHPRERGRGERARDAERAAAGGSAPGSRPSPPGARPGSAPPPALPGRRSRPCWRRRRSPTSARRRPRPRRRRARRRAPGGSRRPRSRSARRFTSCASPGVPASPYQNSPSTLTNRSGAIPRSRCSGPNSKNAYASSLACSASPYWPAATAPSSRSSVAEMTSKSADEPASFHSSG